MKYYVKNMNLCIVCFVFDYIYTYIVVIVFDYLHCSVKILGGGRMGLQTFFYHPFYYWGI